MFTGRFSLPNKQRLLSWGLIAVSALLTPFAYAPYRQYWLLPVLLAVLLLVVHRNKTQRLRLVYVWAWLAYFVQCYWINTALHDIAGLPLIVSLPLTALLPAYLALYPTLVLWLCYRLRLPSVWRLLWAFPLAWTLGEFVRERLLTGFGWGALGYSQMTTSPLAGYAPISGIALVTWAVALIGGALAAVLICANKRHKFTAVLAAVAVTLGGWLLSSTQWTTPDGTTAKVALLQGNIEQSLKWDADAFYHTVDVYHDLLASPKAATADVVILPETAIPAMRQDLPPDLLARFAQTAADNGNALAVGIPQYTADGKQYLNSVIDLSRGEHGAAALPAYSKQHLVPFGEFKPPLTDWLYGLMNMPLADFSGGGAAQTPLALANQRIAFNICYEDSFGDDLIASAQSASLLSNVSNMAWYGTSHAMDLQLQQSQARALELGRYMVRATNTGLTAVLDPKGHIVAEVPRDRADVLVAEVQGYQGQTPYMRLGSTYPLAILMAALLLITHLVSRRLARRRA